jgi:putative acetyltransferase
MTVSIRAASCDDLESIRSLHTRSIAEVCSSDYDADQIAAWLSALNPSRYSTMLATCDVLVAEDDGNIAGFGIADLDSAILNAVYVIPSRLRDGIGSRLVSAIEADARAAGLRRLDLNATLGAVSFYESLGYESDGSSLNELPTGVALPCAAMHKSLL